MSYSISPEWGNAITHPQSNPIPVVRMDIGISPHYPVSVHEQQRYRVIALSASQLVSVVT